MAVGDRSLVARILMFIETQVFQNPENSFQDMAVYGWSQDMNFNSNGQLVTGIYAPPVPKAPKTYAAFSLYTV